MHSSSSNKSNFKVVSGNGGGDSVNINTKSIHPCRLQSRTVAQDFSFPGFWWKSLQTQRLDTTSRTTSRNGLLAWYFNSKFVK